MTLLFVNVLGNAWGATIAAPTLNKTGMGSIGKNTRMKRARRYRKGTR